MNWIDAKANPPAANPESPDDNPNLSDVVLVVDVHPYGAYMRLAYYDHERKAWSSHDGDEYTDTVTHYMPLPNYPPESEMFS